MPRASKKPVSEKVMIELQDNFAYLVSSLSNSVEIQQFFNDFLSDEEKLMLSKRLMLHLMLENGYEAEEICAVLGITKETVRIHKTIRILGGSAYKTIIKKIARREKTKQFWKKVENALKPLDLMLQAKTNMKARAKLLSGDYSDD
jgi:uncharacterized protein YerC